MSRKAKTPPVVSGDSQPAGQRTVPTVYYLDGYHGGIKGHMPPGAVRCILEGLKRHPQWNISLELEPISWTALRRTEPQVYEELARCLADPATRHRIEIVSSSYAQPYCWVINGESNIRHFEHGLRIHREHFPDVPVDSYAVQEPCFTSCLPGILRSFGFVRASLKNNTVFVGCVAGRDAELVNWIGPDGSTIPAIPRYAFDSKVNMWDLRAGFAQEDYAREAVAKGIEHPTGFFFQDCGWAANPWHNSPHTRRITPREYFSLVQAKPALDYPLSQEDIEVSLPWGEKTLHQLAGFVRSAENRILTAEKMAVLAAIWSGQPWPGDRLREAWEQLLLAQHHDGWACCTAARPSRRNWAWQVSAESWVTEEISNEIIASSADRINDRRSAKPQGASSSLCIRIFNTTGHRRSELSEALVSAPSGTRSFRITDPQGRELPCQCVPVRTHHANGSLNAARVLFRSDTPALGTSMYSVAPDPAPVATDGTGVKARIRILKDGCAALETDLYRLVVDTKRGGTVRSLYARHLRKEFVDRRGPRLFNEYRGYFKRGSRWVSTADADATLRIVEDGPLRVQLAIQGTLDTNPFHATITLVQGQPAIDFRVLFHFPQDTWIGDPVETDDARNNFHNSCLDDRWKLQAHFPAALRRQIVWKNAAFDVCRSRHADTFYSNFNDLKHNVILNWVGVTDGTGKYGMALFSDRTTGYAHGPDHPLSLVLGWSGKGWSWWGDCPLRGPQEMRYAIVPHAGTWEDAGLWQLSTQWNEPLIAHVFPSPPERARSLLSVTDPAVELSAAVMEGRDLIVRLFNARSCRTTTTVTADLKASAVSEVELDGRLRRKLKVLHAVPGTRVRVRIPRFGICTLRFSRVI